VNSKILRHLNIGNNGGDDGGGSSTDVRHTNSKAGNSRSTDTVGSSGTDNSIHMGNTHNNPEIRSLFQPIRQRQNAARERKRLPLPPTQLREVFSLFFLLVIKQETQGKVFRFISTEKSLDMP
jgi:hypothetical protein